jgi:hypothetical protein
MYSSYCLLHAAWAVLFSVVAVFSTIWEGPTNLRVSLRQHPRLVIPCVDWKQPAFLTRKTSFPFTVLNDGFLGVIFISNGGFLGAIFEGNAVPERYWSKSDEERSCLPDPVTRTAVK